MHLNTHALEKLSLKLPNTTWLMCWLGLTDLVLLVVPEQNKLLPESVSLESKGQSLHRILWSRITYFQLLDQLEQAFVLNSDRTVALEQFSDRALTDFTQQLESLNTVLSHRISDYNLRDNIQAKEELTQLQADFSTINRHIIDLAKTSLQRFIQALVVSDDITECCETWSRVNETPYATLMLDSQLLTLCVDVMARMQKFLCSTQNAYFDVWNWLNESEALANLSVIFDLKRSAAHQRKEDANDDDENQSTL